MQVVIVNYNTREHLLRCVDSLIDTTSPELVTVTVVDSGSADSSLCAVHQQYSTIQTLSVENRGYGAAANVGMATAASEYVLILNADTEVTSNAVADLTQYMDRHPSVAIAGPQLRYPDGSTQPSRRHFPTRLTPVFESTIFAEWWPGNPWARRYHMEDVPATGCQSVDWLVGAALFIRRAAVDEAGGFDESFRMFAEEVEWCYRLRERGWGICWVPDAIVVHHEGASTAQDVPRRQTDFDRSRILLQRRLYGRSGAMIANIGIKLGYGLMIAREAVKWLIGHRRELRASRIRFYADLLRADLLHHV